MFTAAVGEASLRVTRRAFLESRALDAANAELAALSSSLSDQVAERTEALRALAQHLEQSQETERRRLAHDLHDDLGQQLTAMRYGVARLKGRLDAGGDGRPLVEDLEASLDGTARATRAVITRLRPRILDDLGLLPALEWLGEDVAERAGLPCRVDLDEADPAALATLDAATQLVLYRAAQEGTTNALKHAAAGQIQVSVRCAEGRVEVGVIDDGSGFDPALPNGGFGLLGLRERLVALDGGLRIDSAPGAGTRLCAWVPRSSEEAR